ncbi:hypothetical protein BV898_12486 [Hypsibius exemplaris]|uniref:Uncharacterized protein n=1 Tax=Hypsibius exemplaris TaxID=2072580 RepID=A0A1W0WDK2_HYPEX|nr:hypothetical protein BV898_12486 [Hypsibius exemplaris]
MKKSSRNRASAKSDPRRSSIPLVSFRRQTVDALDDLDGARDSTLPVDAFDHLKVRDFRQFFVGCLFTVVLAVLNALLYNVIRMRIYPQFDAPAFIIWFRSVFRIFTFPIYILSRWMGHLISKRSCMPGAKIVGIIKGGEKVYGDKKMTMGRFLLDISALTVLSVLSQWLCYAPLYAVAGPGDMAALASCNLSFVFILCVIFLRIPMTSMKMFGTAINLGGVVVLTLVEIVGNPKWKTSLLILVGTFFTAAYQVTFRKRVGATTNLSRISYFVSMQAVFMAVFMWPLILALKFYGMEVWEFNDLPWDYLVITSVAVLVMVNIINLGVAHINPIFSTLGFLLVCPATFAVEMLLTPRYVFFVEITGACVAVFGAILLVFGDVNTWATVTTAWNNFFANIKQLRTTTTRSVTNKLESSTSIRITGQPEEHTAADAHRMFNLDPTLVVPEWSQTGFFYLPPSCHNSHFKSSVAQSGFRKESHFRIHLEVSEEEPVKWNFSNKIRIRGKIREANLRVLLNSMGICAVFRSQRA